MRFADVRRSSAVDSWAAAPIIPWLLILLGGSAIALLPIRWTAAALAGSIVITVVLVRPVLALYLICLAIPFGSLYEINLSGITVGVTEGLIVLLIAAWGARILAFREKLAWPRFSAALALFIGTALVSLPNATALPPALKEVIKWVEFLAVMAFVAGGVDRKQSQGLVVCLLAAGVAQALLGAYQFFSQSGPEFFVLRDRYMRAYGTFDQPNPYAGYLGLCAPLGLALGLSLLGRDRDGGLPRWLAWIGLGSFAAIGVAMGMSWSRGGWLAFGAACVAVLIAYTRKGLVALLVLALLLGLVGAGVTFGLFPEAVVARITSFVPFAAVRDVRSVEITDENYAAVERLAFWQAGLDMWRDRPWVGIGIGNYASAYEHYALPKWPMALGHAHNYYLNIAAETGLIGLTAYLFLWASALWHVVRGLRGAETAYARSLALGALGVLVHVSVHNVVDNLWVHNMYIQVAILLGLVQNGIRQRSQVA